MKANTSLEQGEEGNGTTQGVREKRMKEKKKKEKKKKKCQK